jgi:hypothetical protein
MVVSLCLLSTGDVPERRGRRDTVVPSRGTRAWSREIAVQRCGVSGGAKTWKSATGWKPMARQRSTAMGLEWRTAVEAPAAWAAVSARVVRFTEPGATDNYPAYYMINCGTDHRHIAACATVGF